MKKSTDFSRNVIPLFGVPFDVISYDEAERRVMEATQQGRKYFVSTPNLNFLALCQRDEAFRRSVLISDLSVADGMSIITLAKWMGTPLPERIAGSTLFDGVAAKLQKQLRVYLFGGPDGVAPLAYERMNQSPQSGQAVGWQSPGFCSVEQMSTPAHLEAIQSAHPNFLLVALGAQKGQAWIARNYEQLPACVVSHLGAVINFLAQTVQRAPDSMQSMGLEWLWRIKEEPRLWRRYALDAWQVARLMAGHWTDALKRRNPPEPAAISPSSEARLEPTGTEIQLHLNGHWGPANIDDLRQALRQAIAAETALVVDIAAGGSLAPEALGQLLLLAGHQLANGLDLRIEPRSKQLHSLLAKAGLDPWLFLKMGAH